jgi:hypothetical protein
VNAAVANQFSGVEKTARIGTPQKRLTLGARIDTQQAQSIPQAIKIELLLRQDFFQRGIGFFGHGLGLVSIQDIPRPSQRPEFQTAPSSQRRKASTGH